MNQQKIPIANIYYLLCYAWDHVEESDVVCVDEVGVLERVHDLLGKILAEGTFRLIRRGIDRGYREVREDIAGIRGKIAVGETVKRALRSHGRVACTFEEMSHDVLHNPHPAFHTEIVVASSRLGGRCGFECAKCIRQARRNIRPLL